MPMSNRMYPPLPWDARGYWSYQGLFHVYPYWSYGSYWAFSSASSILQLLAQLLFGKYVQTGVNSFMTGLSTLIVWIASIKLRADLNRRSTKLEFPYNKAMQFGVPAYPSAIIMTARKIISTILSQPRFISIPAGRKMSNLTANSADIYAMRFSNVPQTLTVWQPLINQFSFIET